MECALSNYKSSEKKGGGGGCIKRISFLAGLATRISFRPLMAYLCFIINFPCVFIVQFRDVGSSFIIAVHHEPYLHAILIVCAQLTKLKDGMAIGCAFNHAILDGTSTWHFMSSWAQACNGATSVSVPPFLERTKSRNTRVKLDPSLPPDPHSQSSGDAAAKQEPVLREKVFKFSEAAIDKIKSKVNENGPSDGSKPFSTFQSLAVHIWRHVTHARSLKPEDYTVFTVFADCRKRVDPPMPDSYFGNLIQAIFTVTAAGLLTGNPPEFGASMIQKAIEAHTAKAIDERNKEWENAPKIFQFKDAGVNCVAVGSSPRFKVYEVDFGWGKPESVRSGSNNRFDGMVYLYQGKSGGRSIDVEITLEPGAMERLEKDNEFLMEL